MEKKYIRIINKLNEICENKCNGVCVSILNSHGEELFYIKHGKPTPCCDSLSRKKAFTAYSFMGNSDEIYQEMLLIGGQSLITSDYCFIPGGVLIKDNEGGAFFIGISTDKPSIDKQLSLSIADLFRGDI